MPQKQFYDYNSRGPVESFTTAHESLYSRTTHASHLASPFFLSGSDVQLGAIKMANRPRWAGLFVFFPLFFIRFVWQNPHNQHKTRCIFNLKSTTKREQRKKRVIYKILGRWRMNSLKYLGKNTAGRVDNKGYNVHLTRIL